MSASWTHLASRPLVRPLIRLGVRPNHLTTLRVLTGVAACACLALGSREGAWWGGGLWLVSAFLDRADGELARLGNMQSRAGHLYDYYSDTAINGLLFLAMGIGARHSWLGEWAVPLGAVGGVALVVCGIVSEALEQRSPPDTRAYSGRWGFDPDDALYLMGPLAWLGWLSPIVLGAAVGATAMAVITSVRLGRLVRAEAPASR